jgi:hypothetical protein
MEILLTPLEPEGKVVKVLSEGRVIRVEHPSANEAQGGFAALTEGSAIVRSQNAGSRKLDELQDDG